jgi:hypothetical protein
MAAAATHAALKAKWVVAQQTLQALPTAAADKHLPKTTLHDKASQAEVDCSCAMFNTSPEQKGVACQTQLGPVLGLIADELQVCAPGRHTSGTY